MLKSNRNSIDCFNFQSSTVFLGFGRRISKRWNFNYIFLNNNSFAVLFFVFVNEEYSSRDRRFASSMENSIDSFRRRGFFNPFLFSLSLSLPRNNESNREMKSQVEFHRSPRLCISVRRRKEKKKVPKNSAHKIRTRAESNSPIESSPLRKIKLSLSLSLSP